MGVVLKGVVRLLHGDETRVHCLPLLAGPRLRDQLGAELEDQAEDAVDDVHDRGRFLCQEAPGGSRVEARQMLLGKGAPAC